MGDDQNLKRAGAEIARLRARVRELTSAIEKHQAQVGISNPGTEGQWVSHPSGVLSAALAFISTDPIPDEDLERAKQYVRDQGWEQEHAKALADEERHKDG